MICPKCKTSNNKKDKKCSNCGTNLDPKKMSNVIRKNHRITIKPRKVSKRKEGYQEEVLGSFNSEEILDTKEVLEEVETLEEIPEEEIVENVETLEEVEVEEPVETLEEVKTLEEIPTEPSLEMTETLVIDDVLNDEPQNSLDNIETLQIDNSLSSEPVVNSAVVINDNVEVQPQENNETLDIDSSKSKKDNKKVLLSIVIIVFVLLVAAIVFIIFRKKNESPSDTVTNKTFFIEDSKGKYAIFDEDGNKISDFIYTDHSDFINGSAIVYKDKDVGIVNESGQMTTDFGKYKTIENATYMYKANTKKYEYYLIDMHDNVIYDLNDKDLTTFNGVDNYSILKDKKKYIILNKTGKIIVEFTEDEDNIPYVNENEGVISVFYNNKNYIYDVDSNKKISEFESEKQFCIDSVYDNKNVIILNSCSSQEEDESKDYSIIKNGKSISINEECDKVSFENDDILCEQKDKAQIIDEEGNSTLDISDKMYSNYKTYAQNKNSSVELYKDGELINTLSCKSIVQNGYAKNNMYLINQKNIKACAKEDSGFEFYDVDGNKKIDKIFKIAKPFDKNGIALVSEDGTHYYLMNSSLEKISEEYDLVENQKDYYIVTKGNLKGIVDKSGNLLLETKYRNITILDIKNRIIAKLVNEYGKTIVYDIANKKEIVSSSNNMNINDHYIEILKSDKTEYYTYSGKKFYEK